MKTSTYAVKTNNSNFNALFIGGEANSMFKEDKYVLKKANLKSMKDVNRAYVFRGNCFKRIPMSNSHKKMSIQDFIDSLDTNEIGIVKLGLQDDGDSVIYENNVKYSQRGYKYHNNITDHTMLEEEKFLGEHLNYYLGEFGLKKIDMSNLVVDKENNVYPLYLLSTCGDAELKSAVLENISDGKLISYMNSNEYQKSVMVRMGFGELSNLEKHFVGTLFESIYHVAILQDNKYVVNSLINELLGTRIQRTKRTVTFVD